MNSKDAILRVLCLLGVAGPLFALAEFAIVALGFVEELHYMCLVCPCFGGLLLLGLVGMIIRFSSAYSESREGTQSMVHISLYLIPFLIAIGIAGSFFVRFVKEGSTSYIGITACCSGVIGIIAFVVMMVPCGWLLGAVGADIDD